FFINNGVPIIYAVPGMVIATIFVSLPFVVREVAPVLLEAGDEQEQAAATLGASSWQTFRRVTLPPIRWGVAYALGLTTARARGAEEGGCAGRDRRGRGGVVEGGGFDADAAAARPAARRDDRRRADQWRLRRRVRARRHVPDGAVCNDRPRPEEGEIDAHRCP